MGHRFEVWSHPSTGTFARRILRLPVESASFTPRNSGADGGRITLPPRYPYLASVIRRDPLNPANDVRSVIRVFDDDAPDVTIPEIEMVPVSVPDAIDASKPIEVICEGVNRNFLRGAIVWAFDHPTFHQPDWIWGGANILANPSFEQTLIKPERYTLGFDATGGTFQMTVDGDTANIAIPTNAGAVKFALEGLGSVVKVEVNGAGTIPDPFTISFHDPADPFVTVNGGGLTGGGYAFAITEGGNLTAASWETSRNPSNNLQHGAYSFVGLVTSPAPFDGVYSLAFNGDDVSTWDFPGIQQINANVTPGLYQAKARVNPASATDLYALVIRDTMEGLIDTLVPGVGAKVEQTSAAGVFTEIAIPNVVIDPGEEAIIFRVAYTGGGNPGEIRVDLCELRPGMAPATAGEIIRLLHEDAALNHVADTPTRVALQYITLNFSDTLDANGAAWDRLLSVTIPRGWTYWQVMEMLHEQFGYEFDLRPDPVTVGEWILDVWNPGTRNEQDPDLNEAIIVGINAAIAGPVAFEAVVGNAILAEGAGRLWTRSEDAASITAAGRIESYVPMGNVLDQATLDAAAAAQLAEQLDQGLSVQIVMAPAARPLLLTELPLGARNYLSVPGFLDKYGIRLDAVTLDWARGDSLPTRTGHWSREVYQGQTAVNEMTRRLAERAAVLNPPEPKQTNQLGAGGTGGQAPSVIVAAFDSSDLDKSHADIRCGDGDTATDIWKALTLARSGFPAGLPGWVHFSAGHYPVDMSLSPAFDAQDLMVTGVGYGYSGNGTVFEMYGSPASVRPFLFEGEYSIFRDFGIEDNTDYSHSITGIVASELTVVENITGWSSGHFIEVNSNTVSVINCHAMFSGYGGDTGPNHCISMTGAVAFMRIVGNICTGTDGYGIHTRNGGFGTETSVMANNVIETCGTGGIFLGITGADGTGTVGSRWGWSVTGNTVESCSTDWAALTERGASIYIEYSPGCSVVGNTITNAEGHGIIVDANGGGSNIAPWVGGGGGLILSGNSVTRSTGYVLWFRNEDTEIKYYPAIVSANNFGGDSNDNANIARFDRVRDISVQANTFQRVGLYLLECEQVSVLANKFIDPSYGNDGGTTGKTGIIELDDSHWCTVKGNDFQAVEGVVNTNPFACVYLLNGSDQNRIRGNDYLGAAAISVGATLIDHGVWFAASAGVNNRAVGNDFERCTGASIRDDVGGNVIIWPGGGNDNW